MAPVTKDHEILTAAQDATAGVAAQTGSRLDDTASRPQPVALEVPVSVNGARTVEGSDKREPFSETTKTVLVFGNGAVIRLGSPVAPGQLLFLTNEKTKKEVVCQVVKSKNYRNVSGYVELEFTESVVGFWGMRFPAGRSAAPTPAASPAKPTKSVAPASVTVAPPTANFIAIATPGIHEVKPSEIKAGGRAAAPVVPNPEVPRVRTIAVPATPAASKPEIPSIPAPSMSASVTNLADGSERKPSLTASVHSALPIPPESKPASVSVVAENSSEELKFHGAPLQGELSGLLFSEPPTANAAPTVPALEVKSIPEAQDKIFDMAKPDPAPAQTTPRANTLPTPMKSSFDTEEVKIPSWLEPLARNAAAPPLAQDVFEDEKGKDTIESALPDEPTYQFVPPADAEIAHGVELPGVGSLLALGEEAPARERASGGSRRGVWIGTIAAGVLLAAGGAWYQYYPSNTQRAPSTPVSPASGAQPEAALPEHSEPRPEEHPALRNEAAKHELSRGLNAEVRSSSPSLSQPNGKSLDSAQAVHANRENTHASVSTIPAAVMERIPRTAPEPELKKPTLGEVHLAAPTLNRADAAQDDRAIAPTISAGNLSANSAGFASGLAAVNGKQPAVPEVPLPVGGDVQPATLISRVSPVYPMLAKNQHVAGDVVIDALIDANGRVTTMKVISGPTLLYRAAKDALHQWKYQPASLNGKPVAMHLKVTLQFRIE